ncbi:MAG TPA: DNA methyltransferase, partial [Hyphomonas sp.]|nr:DNA methyltransferase [Hyphomonas sp.]
MADLISDGRVFWGVSASNFPRQKRYLSEVRQGVVPSTLWVRDQVGDNQEAARELNQIFSETYGVFDTPKPLRLMRRILEIATDLESDDIVLDFFAGSCSMPHAVMQYSSLSAKRLSYIAVQLPLPIGHSDLDTIAAVGKERLRRAISKITSDNALEPTLYHSGDVGSLGFRVFKLSPSHFADWSGTATATPADYHHQLEAFTDPLTQRYDAEAVIWEVAIKEGYALTSRVEAAAVAGHVVYRVSDPDRGQHFHICLDDEVAPELAAALG